MALVFAIIKKKFFFFFLTFFPLLFLTIPLYIYIFFFKSGVNKSDEMVDGTSMC